MKNKTFIASVISILFGLLIGSIVIYVASPYNFTQAITILLEGGFYAGSSSIAKLFSQATPIMMTGLSVAFAYKCGLFNIGTPGQFIVGEFVALFIVHKFTFIPPSIIWIVAVLCAGLAGALWASIPGILKAYKNVNIVIACIMMNYIGMLLVIEGIKKFIYNPAGAESYQCPPESAIPSFGLKALFNQEAMTGGIIIAILLCVLAYIVMSKTIFGYELKATGFNKDACFYAGMNEKRNTILTMAIAGFFSGVGGALTILSGNGGTLGVAETLPPEGFNGIPVALLGASHPLGVIAAALFIGHLNVGGFYMQSCGIAIEVINVIIAVIIFFASFSLFIKLLLESKGKGGKA